ncbi:hypothetical protein [Variovorax sp. PAMC26660]|uniref:hypothetical protein n=1 Tax=Variovorax sp. PAMC26660 TaxID=2762322 RepID=UPI00164DAF83|nr:hypothetical protein [Variovorax sp. PAMC26660]QNK71208.1 hypothetical protein H7F35_16670 [Variovorax sp. PAMC26660]
MAESARICVQSHDPSVSLEPSITTLDDLALQTCDDADSLNEVLRAYTAFEKLIEPGALNDSEALTPTRSELSALLRLLNEALVARIDAVNAAAGDLRRALMQGSLPSAA